MVVFKTWKHLLFGVLTSVVVWNLNLTEEERLGAKSQTSRQEIKD